MSDHFLNKLKSIRERYGINQPANGFIKIQQKPQSSRRNFSFNKDHNNIPRQEKYIPRQYQRTQQLTLALKPTSYEKPTGYDIPQPKRPVSSHKRLPLQPNYQNLLNQKQSAYISSKRNLCFQQRQQNMTNPQFYKTKFFNQPQSFQFQPMRRTYSQQKRNEPVSNNYNLIYNYDQLPSQTTFKPQTVSQTLNKDTSRLNNIENTNFSYESLVKPMSMKLDSRPPSLSCFNRTENKWTIDKLCQVQEKIQAYLRK